MTQTRTFRIRYQDFKKLKIVFPAFRDETAANYFHRLRIWLEENSDRSVLK